MPGATIGGGVTLRGINDPKYNHVWNFSGVVNRAADLGKAVSQDITADATAKLAADGDAIIGALFSYEDRLSEGIKVATISRKGYFMFTYSGANPTRGHGVVGAGAGLVKGTTAAAEPGQPFIVALDTVLKTVLVWIG